ncbi:putative ADP-ribosylation factor GTPase-activating protein 1-like [Homarus americanus]|uniref:Putative ADP-ribosylation factor GTPase-activating protein 1-like n=1 Tax=Homarus americanus TaxID=6706 RepID=A0A8J5MR83_HOMAM|nr:putative ADP-ribosylation factor GTPase-activating protein 1-like [Homarus americanus]
MADLEISVGRGRLRTCLDEDDDEEESSNQGGGPGTLAPWTRSEGSRAAFGRLKAKLFETRLATHVRQAQLALADSIKHAGWAVEHKGEIERHRVGQQLPGRHGWVNSYQGGTAVTREAQGGSKCQGRHGWVTRRLGSPREAQGGSTVTREAQGWVKATVARGGTGWVNSCQEVGWVNSCQGGTGWVNSCQEAQGGSTVAREAQGGSTVTREAQGGSRVTREAQGGSAVAREAQGGSTVASEAQGGSTFAREAQGGSAITREAWGGSAICLGEDRGVSNLPGEVRVVSNVQESTGWVSRVSEVSRRGWSEATRAWGSGGAGGGTLALTGSSGGPHERSSLLLGPGDGYQRLDNNSISGNQAALDSDSGPQNDILQDKEDEPHLRNENVSRSKDRHLECNDGWGDDNWTNDWGSSNNSKASSPLQTRMDSPDPSPNARVSKKNANNSSKKSKGSTKKDGKAEQELLVDLGNNGTKGHTWDNWDDDWEKVDGQ